MTLINRFFKIFCACCLGVCLLKADGVMRPTDTKYPENFLRTRMTKIDVTLNGQIAVTKVYQEFVNEWVQKTDAVYSFPLPVDARATDFFFWANDTMYQAVLKVKEQATNPGTGEGGIDALLNTYLGKNSIRILVNDIPAGQIQKTQLEYISLCTYDNGRIHYSFPFNTQDFVTTPLESFSVTVHVNAADDIAGGTINGDVNTRTVKADARHWTMTLDRSKVYPTSNLAVDYQTSNSQLNVEMYGISNDTLDGHFVMIVKPQTTLDSSTVLRKNVVFLVDCSSSTIGTPFTSSTTAVKQCLTTLRAGDVFNIVTINTTAAAWSAKSVAATPANIASAQAYLAARTASGGSNLAAGLTSALSMFNADTVNNIIMMFSDGMSPADPKTVTAQNIHQAAIFPIAISDNPGRARLELIAYQNNGFPTFLATTDPLYDNILAVFAKVNAPVLRSIRMEFGSNVYGILPQTLQTVYAGSRFYLTGRFRHAGASSLAIAGTSSAGDQFMNYTMNFPTDKSVNKFAERFWAKEAIDDIERQISVYGVTDSLKQLDIKYSLTYNIRCQYTAYIADKTKPVTSSVETNAAIENVVAVHTANTVTLSWDAPGTNGMSDCSVYRSTTSNGVFVKLNASSITGMTFVDRDAAPGRVYYYRIEIITRTGQRLCSAVISSEGRVMPAGFALERNYPNPFNPGTTIRFTVGSAGQVRLTVYDVLGRECAVLADERLQPGTYERRWNAGALPSGIYYCRMSTQQGFSAVQKMLLQK